MAEANFTDDNFEAEVKKSDKPVLVDFFAEWCGPCKMLSPIVEELSGEHDDWKIGKCDIDANPGVVKEFSITSVPTLLFFKDGKVVDKIIGFKSKEDIEAKLG